MPSLSQQQQNQQQGDSYTLASRCSHYSPSPFKAWCKSVHCQTHPESTHEHFLEVHTSISLGWKSCRELPWHPLRVNAEKLCVIVPKAYCLRASSLLQKDRVCDLTRKQ